MYGNDKGAVHGMTENLFEKNFHKNSSNYLTNPGGGKIGIAEFFSAESIYFKE